MVIEPPSLTFLSVPSCAAAGAAMTIARAARIRVIGRVMSVSLWAVRAGGWMGGGGCRILRESPVPCPSAPAARGTAQRLGRTRIRSLPPEGARHEPGADANRARPPGRPGGPRRRLLRHPHAARAGELSHHGDGDLHLPGARARAR